MYPGEAVHTEEYKGYEIAIYPDDNPFRPDESGEESLYLVGFHRDFSVGKMREEFAQTLYNGGKDEEGTKDEEAVAFLKRYHVFPIEAYIHGGVALSLQNEGNFPDRRWDVSLVGLVFVEKKIKRTRKAARKSALSLIEEWNDYLSGNVYGYVVRKNGERVDDASCWGFYGDYKKWCLTEARSAVDAEVAYVEKQKQKRVKSLIQNRVPLEVRASVVTSFA